jgi:hypothetical protein
MHGCHPSVTLAPRNADLWPGTTPAVTASPSPVRDASQLPDLRQPPTACAGTRSRPCCRWLLRRRRRLHDRQRLACHSRQAGALRDRHFTHMPKIACRPGAYLCTKWNTHSRTLDPADDRRRAFSIVPIGNQIAESERWVVVADALAITCRLNISGVAIETRKAAKDMSRVEPTST